jgi:chorismate mutase
MTPTESIPRLHAIRGATTVPADTSDAIGERTSELIAAILDRNVLAADDIVSMVFTATPDLTADFPAVAARAAGLSRTPLLCCQEIPVRGAMQRCVRVLLHCYLADGHVARHVYLHDARQLRLDLPE